MNSSKVSIKTRSTPSQVTKHTTVKWSIFKGLLIEEERVFGTLKCEKFGAIGGPQLKKKQKKGQY